jgi:hypothetical protein
MHILMGDGCPTSLDEVGYSHSQLQVPLKKSLREIWTWQVIRESGGPAHSVEEALMRWARSWRFKGKPHLPVTNSLSTMIDASTVSSVGRPSILLLFRVSLSWIFVLGTSQCLATLLAHIIFSFTALMTLHIIFPVLGTEVHFLLKPALLLLLIFLGLPRPGDIFWLAGWVPRV